MLQWHCGHHTAYREATPTGLSVYILTAPVTSADFFFLQPSCEENKYVQLDTHQVHVATSPLALTRNFCQLTVPAVSPHPSDEANPARHLSFLQPPVGARHFKKHGQVVRRVLCTCPEVLFLLLSSRGCTVGCTDAWCSSFIDSFTAMLRVNFIQKQ